MQNFSDILQGKQFSNWELNEAGVRKMCVFQRKTGNISEMVKDTAKVTINH